MAKTLVSDVIVPTEFEKYAIERTAELSNFGQCGIIEMAPEFDTLAQGGGREVKMPFWKDLTATRQLLSDSASLTVNKIAADTDIARIHNDAQVWSVNHLAKVVSGDDPMQAIVDLVAAYWARTDEALVISCLKGMFSAASMSGNLLAIHSESVAATTSSTKLNGATFVDACAKLGDAASRLVDSQFQFNGFRSNEGQALQWPRERCPDPDRNLVTISVLSPVLTNYVPSTSVPKAVVWAVCEMARELLLEDRTAAPAGEGISSSQSSSSSHDASGGTSTQTSISYSKEDTRPVMSRVAQAMLAKYGGLIGGSGTVRLVRA